MNDKQHLTSTAYSEFNLPDSIQQGLQDAGFEYCTPIQAETLPYTLKGQDLAGEAQTGTGKTAAFLVALFNHLMQHPAADNRRVNQPRALVLAPTRELALQIHKDAEVLGKHTGFKIGLVYGGTGYNEQRQQLTEGVDVLIGTPGRIIDYFKQKVFDLRAAQVVVLDEADRMFDLGFIKDIRFLIRRCPDPDQRLSMLFSATLSHRVNELAYEHMNNPHNVSIESETRTADNVKQTVYYPANEEKIPLLLGLLQRHQPTRAIVFINTKHTADKIYAYLKGNDIPVAILSGDVPQTKRTSLLQGFQDGKYTVLVATDVAARGLHIPEVSHVINFDLPQSAEDYVHRVGRTARAGAHGQAISFACEHYAHHLPEIEEYLGHRIDNEAVDLELLVTPKPPVKLERRKPDDRKRGPKRDDKRGGQRSPKSGPRKGPRSGRPPEERKAAQQKPKSDDRTDQKKRRRRKPSPKQTAPRAPQSQQQPPQAKKPGVIKRLIDSIFG